MKKFTLAAIGFLVATTVVAQPQMNPAFDLVPAPTNPTENTFVPPNPSSRLTGQQQRPTADSKEQIIYSVGSSNGVVTDSTSFIFVGEDRFSYPPNAPIYTASLHDFDTSFRFTNASGLDNFASFEVRDYDADNKIIKSSSFDAQGNLSIFTDYEYYPDGILKRVYMKQQLSATDSFISEENYSPSGKLLSSYRNQDLPSFGSAFWWRESYSYNYDQEDRLIEYVNLQEFPAQFADPSQIDSNKTLRFTFYMSPTSPLYLSDSTETLSYNQGSVVSSSYNTNDYTYDSNENLMEYVTSTNGDLSRKVNYSYNSANQVIENMSSNYDLGNQNWVNSQKYTYDYDNDIQTENKSYFWNGNDWVMQFQGINHVNADGLVDSIKGINYDINEAVTYKTLQALTYTDLANVKQVVTIGEDPVNNDTTQEVVFNLYRTIEATGIDAVLNDVALSIYPNPARDLVNIRLSVTEGNLNDWTLVVSNVEGRIIMTDKAKEKMEINTTFWNAGIYFMTLRNNQNHQTVTKQVVKY